MRLLKQDLTERACIPAGVEGPCGLGGPYALPILAVAFLLLLCIAIFVIASLTAGADW